MTQTQELCPCCSQLAYDACCGPLISGAARAETAEQLMRSRYSAYVKGEMGYLFETTHPDGRKGYDHDGTKEWSENSEWQKLEILAVRGGAAGDQVGEVEFKAYYEGKGAQHIHHEVGVFRKLEDVWFFTDGKIVGNVPIRSTKVGRNEPCTCGSGKKYKKCCGA